MTARKVAAKQDEGKKEQTAENQEECCLESVAADLVSRGKILSFLDSVKEEVKTRGDREALDGFIESLAVISNEINVIATELAREVDRVYREFKAL